MSLLQTPDFPENNNLMLFRKYKHRVTNIKSKSVNLLPNRYQLLEPTSKNIKLVPGKIE